MSYRVRFLTIGTFLAVAAATAGVAFADKPLLPPPPAPIQLAPGVLPSGVLRTVKPLSPTAKLNLLKSPTGAVPTEQQLDQPIRLNARTPYIDTNTYLAVYDAALNPSFEPPELIVRGGAMQARVQFRAEADRTYLIDCAVDPSNVRQFSTNVYGKIVGTGAAVVGPTGTVSPPPDRHLTFVVRKDANPRDMVVEIIGTGGSNWRLGTCEITSVRGL